MRKTFLIIPLLLICSNAFALQVKVVSEKDPDETLESFCAMYKYQAEIKNEQGVVVPNPTSKLQYANNVLRTLIQESAASYDSAVKTELDRKKNYTDALIKHKVEEIVE